MMQDFVIPLLSIISTTFACMATHPGEMPSIQDCLTCDENLLVITTTGHGAQNFDSDVVVEVNGCAERILTCVGPNARIKLNDGQVTEILDKDDGVVDDVATLTVTCNADGTEWLRNGVAITQAECQAGNCLTCDQNWIEKRVAGAGSHVFDGDVTVVNSNGCLQRTFTCAGVNPNIEMPPLGVIFDGDDGTVDGKATLTVECNYDGSEWENNQLGFYFYIVLCASG